MGKSKSIEEQQKQNQEFQNYLSDIRKSLSEKAKVHEEEFQNKVQRYYGSDYSNVVRIGFAEKYDFRQMDEVTFKNLQDVIKDTVDAIFPGTKQEQSMDEKAKTAIATVSDFRGLATAVATNLIMGAMNILSSSSEITFNYSIKSESICPGLTLHVLVANDAYKDSRWFHNTEIVESYVRYELIFSYSQIQTEMDIKYFNYQLASIEKIEEALNVLRCRYAEALMDPDISDERVASMKTRIEMAAEQLQESREEVRKAIAAHNANRMKAALESAAGVHSFTSQRMEGIAAYMQSAGVLHE